MRFACSTSPCRYGNSPPCTSAARAASDPRRPSVRSRPRTRAGPRRARRAGASTAGAQPPSAPPLDSPAAAAQAIAPRRLSCSASSSASDVVVHRPRRQGLSRRPRPAEEVGRMPAPRIASSAPDARSRAAAYSRIVSSIANRGPTGLSTRRRRLSSTSDPMRPRMSGPVRDRLGGLDRAAAAGTRPAARRAALAAGSSSSWLQSRVASSVCWRAGRSRAPAVSSSSDRSSRPAIASGGSSLLRAAASSSASGRPSSRVQISARRCRRVPPSARSAGRPRAPARRRARPPRAAAAAAPGTRARPRGGAARGSSRARASPARPPVARATNGAPGSSCSKLSSTSRSRRVAQPLRDRLPRPAASPSWSAERLLDGGGEQLGIPQRRQVDEARRPARRRAPRPRPVPAGSCRSRRARSA